MAGSIARRSVLLRFSSIIALMVAKRYDIWASTMCRWTSGEWNVVYKELFLPAQCQNVIQSYDKTQISLFHLRFIAR